MLLKTEDQIVHFISLQWSFFDMCEFIFYSYFWLILSMNLVTRSWQNAL